MCRKLWADESCNRIVNIPSKSCTRKFGIILKDISRTMFRHALICIMLYSSTSLVLGNEMMYCPAGKFQQTDEAPCMDCSRCPDNQIVRETCWRKRDTVCGAFTEFQPFHSDRDTNRNIYNIDLDHDGGAGTVNDVTQHETDDIVTGYWQAVSIGMMVLLSVTTVLCIAMISAVCYWCRRDKKDGLLVYVGKNSADVHSLGDSDPVSQQIKHGSDVSPASASQSSGMENTDDHHGNIHCFEITEGSFKTRQ